MIYSFLISNARLKKYIIIFLIFCFYINIFFFGSIKKTNQYYIKNNFNLYSILVDKINEIFLKNGAVNLNQVEGEINVNKIWKPCKNKSNEMNIGIHLDSNFLFQAMITLASIMDSQRDNLRIRFHIAVVLNFTAFDMLKIYSLRDKIRNETEFNFYNASRVEKDLYGLNTKGPGLLAKLLLPQLIPNDINKLLLFDIGDILVLRDLTELYNWDMKDNMYVGVPDKRLGQKSLITKKIYKNYINVGSFLINVTKVKSENMYDKFKKYKNFYHSYMGDQDILNDVAFGKVGMFPLKFGRYSPFKNDINTEVQRAFYRYLPSHLNESTIEFLKAGYTPYVIHHWNSKWSKGYGLTIFRRIVQYYIRYAGIWVETCSKFPGYCFK